MLAALILALASSAEASTRFYFPATTAADVAPVANGSWGETDGALNRLLVMGTKSNTALANGSQLAFAAGTTQLDRRYVSDPIQAMTLSGTVACVVMSREFANGDNTTSRFEVYVVHNDGQTVRGTCLAIAQYGPDTEMINNATLRNKRFADGDTISNVTCSEGDRIVVCIGYANLAGGASPEGQSKYGDPTSGTDLAENETNTTANPGWVEFSASIAKANTPTFTATATSTSTATATATATISGTDTETATVTATATVSGTDTETATRTSTATETATVTATATVSGTDTDTATVTATATETATITATATTTGTETETATETATPTATATETTAGTPTFTATVTATLAVTPTWTFRPPRIWRSGGSG